MCMVDRFHRADEDGIDPVFISIVIVIHPTSCVVRYIALDAILSMMLCVGMDVSSLLRCAPVIATELKGIGEGLVSPTSYRASGTG